MSRNVGSEQVAGLPHLLVTAPGAPPRTRRRRRCSGIGSVHAGQRPAGRLAVGRRGPRRRRRACSCGIGPVLGRPREVRRALEDGELGGLLGDDRDRLDARRAGADDGHPLAGEVDALVRPAGRGVDVALEAVGALDVGHLRQRQAPGGHHEVAARDVVAGARCARASGDAASSQVACSTRVVELGCRGAGRACRRRSCR